MLRANEDGKASFYGNIITILAQLLGAFLLAKDADYVMILPKIAGFVVASIILGCNLKMFTINRQKQNKMSKREQLIEKAWGRVASLLSLELDRPVSIDEAREIIAKRKQKEEEAKNIKEQERLQQKQKRLQQKQERLQREQERLQEEQRLKKEQKEIQHRFGINVLEETVRFRELEKQKNLKEEQEKNAWKFKKPNESWEKWIARIKEHNNKQRALYHQHHGKQ